MSRRRWLKQVGVGIETGIMSAVMGKVLTSEPRVDGNAVGSRGSPAGAGTSGKTPISLIIDDGAPVDPLFYEIPGYETPFLVPAEFTRRVAETFDRFDLRGKITIIPMPSCLGRIDQSLKRVPQDHLEAFLKLVRERIAPRFDITPEFLTHLRAYNLKTGEYQHIYEDVWISQAPIKEIVEYFVLAFTILKNVGLMATGITSPWVSGIDVEKKYAQALAEAQWKTFERKLTWYFLHMTGWGKPRQCSVEYEAPERGQIVVSVPANAEDIFWSMEKPTRADRLQFINEGIDRVVSADGRSGRIRELMEAKAPVVLLTHWQSLYTQGTALGLDGLCALAERIQKVFGNSLEWVSCSELARRSITSKAVYT
ncbi:MAG TPA: hypothetical protein VMW38_22225 [Terriglobia bacterium]|nr:hypothetical protein [Terriglobia bacterium]